MILDSERLEGKTSQITHMRSGGFTEHMRVGKGSFSVPEEAALRELASTLYDVAKAGQNIRNVHIILASRPLANALVEAVILGDDIQEQCNHSVRPDGSVTVRDLRY